MREKKIKIKNHDEYLWSYFKSGKKKDKKISLGNLIAKKDRNESININLNYK